ncbi:MAG: hypothetical protein ABEJ99_01850 [Candidatus Nanohaloarchaea archaeon]
MDKEFGWKTYHGIDSIAHNLLDEDVERMLEREFREKARYGLDERNSKADHCLGSFELSYLLSEKMARDTGKIFYNHRKDDFREFVDETRPKGSANYSTNQLTQLSQLYNNIAKDRDLSIDDYPASVYTPPTRKKEIGESMLHIIEDIVSALEN